MTRTQLHATPEYRRQVEALRELADLGLVKDADTVRLERLAAEQAWRRISQSLIAGETGDFRQMCDVHLAMSQARRSQMYIAAISGAASPAGPANEHSAATFSAIAMAHAASRRAMHANNLPRLNKLYRWTP